MLSKINQTLREKILYVFPHMWKLKFKKINNIQKKREKTKIIMQAATCHSSMLLDQ